MPQAVPKFLKHPFEEPIFIRGGIGIATRGVNNSNLIRKKDRMHL
jgi:hypothetical protein